MSQKTALFTLSVAATAALSANTFITLTGATAAAGAAAQAVATTDADVGDLVPADVLGTTNVIAEAAIAMGAALQVGAAGGATPQVAGGVCVAYALEDAAIGELLEVLLVQGGNVGA